VKGHRIIVVVGDFNDNTSRITLDASLLSTQRTSTTIFSVVDNSDVPASGEREITWDWLLPASSRPAQEVKHSS
jgi:hypothetical protein